MSLDLNKKTSAGRNLRTPWSVHRVIGATVANLRREKGLSSRDLALALRVAPASLAAYENGTSPIGAAELMRIAQILDVPVTLFFRDLRND